LESESTVTKPMLHREDAARYLGIHVNTLDLSDIPRVRFGRYVFFKRDVLDKCFDTGFETKRRNECKKS